MALHDSLKKFIRETIKNTLQTQMEVVEKKLATIIEDLKKENKNWRDSITAIFEKLSGKITQLEKRFELIENVKLCLEKQMEEVQTQMNYIKNNLERKEEQMDILQYRLMQNALRIRGFPEEEGENLIDIFSLAVAKMTDVQPADILLQIEKIYRVNSSMAAQNHVPRDVIIYFTNRRLRDGILQISYRNKIQIKGQKVMVFKEIPYKILARRKEFGFLVNELKNRQILYRWEIPVGLSLTYQGKKYCLDTLQKAKDFYDKELKAETQPSLEIKAETQPPPEIKKTNMEFKIIKENIKEKNIRRDKARARKEDESRQQFHRMLDGLSRPKQQSPRDLKIKEVRGAMDRRRYSFIMA